jgi:GntR family transcriptional repressor for pyruvate dehydrogenase complex
MSNADFGTFTRDALPDQIASRLIGLISERRLNPGDRLPPERELAVTMGVSRSSLREALRALSMLGVTEMRHGDGTYLTALDPAALMRPFGLVLSLTEDAMKDLFEARRLIEPGLAALAAERIDAPTLEALHRCVADAEDAVGDEDAFMHADLELHGLIAQAASNSILSRVVDSLGGLGVASRRATTGLPGVQRQTISDHREIVAALAAHDPTRAGAAMLRHIENVERAA